MYGDMCGYWFALAWMSGLIDWPSEEEKERWERIKKKAPWELTRKEWWVRTQVRHNGEEIVLELPNGKVKSTGLRDLGDDIDTYAERRKLLMKLAFEAHREEIARALKEGKPVPREAEKEVISDGRSILGRIVGVGSHKTGKRG